MLFKFDLLFDWTIKYGWFYKPQPKLINELVKYYH
jgi:hypothetical protein